MASTTTVKCPQLVCAGCGGQPVVATYRSTTVDVAPCQPLIEQGWQGDVAVVLWHNQALAMLAPVTPTVVQHREGLVAIG